MTVPGTLAAPAPPTPAPSAPAPAALAGDGCAAVSRMLGEPVAGTAAPVRSWLLVEAAGAWSRTAREDLFTATLPLARLQHLEHLRTTQGLRPLLIRRHGRPADAAGPTVLVGGGPPGATWMERVALRSLDELAGLDLDAVAHGAGGLGEPVDGPVLLVCTHGAKDMCCAVSGRPLAAALTRTHGERVWECSHLGGDRFAGNLAVAPYGLFFGHLSPAAGLAVAERVVAGELPLEHYRGRSCWPPVGQWAEAEARRLGGFAGIDDVVVTGLRVVGGASVVDLATPGGPWRVRAERASLGRRAESRCAGLLAPARFTTLAAGPLDGRP